MKQITVDTRRYRAEHGSGPKQACRQLGGYTFFIAGEYYGSGPRQTYAQALVDAKKMAVIKKVDRIEVVS